MTLKTGVLLFCCGRSKSRKPPFFIRDDTEKKFRMVMDDIIAAGKKGYATENEVK